MLQKQNDYYKIYMFRNFKQIDYLVYGRGSLNQLGDIIKPHRKTGAPMVFLVDHFFENKTLHKRLPVEGNDMLMYVDVTDEPKTKYIDEIADKLKKQFGTVSGIIGIGGGSAMDIAKAVSLMMGNPGKAHEYQGWDLVKNPGVYKVGIPTISGTGSRSIAYLCAYRPYPQAGHEQRFYSF